jgi:hypothetical protein
MFLCLYVTWYIFKEYNLMNVQHLDSRLVQLVEIFDGIFHLEPCFGCYSV